MDCDFLNALAGDEKFKATRGIARGDVAGTGTFLVGANLAWSNHFDASYTFNSYTTGVAVCVGDECSRPRGWGIVKVEYHKKSTVTESGKGGWGPTTPALWESRCGYLLQFAW